MAFRPPHQHKEAFCLMKYAAEDGSEVEWIWNSRDGITPFCVANRAGTRMLQHVDWHLDRYLPNYQPQPSERIFVDLTPERALQRATAKVEYWWERPEYPLSLKFDSREEAIASFLKDFKIGQDSDLVEAGTALPVDSSKTGKAHWN